MTQRNEEIRLLSPWWSPVTLAVGTCWQYAIGPLTLYLKRQQQEWLIASARVSENEELYRVVSHSATCMPASSATRRFIFKRSPDSFTLLPVLADRAVVVKTLQPVIIPPAEKLTFYISSPVFVQIRLAGEPLPLQEIPTVALSDTWVGPSTQTGDLCYATRTLARTDKAEVPLRPHRAVTPVTLSNTSKRMLTIEKISIPVPFLSVYGAANGTLWTEAITLTYDGETSLARLTFDKNLPDIVTSADRLSSPRFPPDRHHLVRMFSEIFSDN